MPRITTERSHRRLIKNNSVLNIPKVQQSHHRMRKLACTLMMLPVVVCADPKPAAVTNDSKAFNWSGKLTGEDGKGTSASPSAKASPPKNKEKSPTTSAAGWSGDTISKRSAVMNKDATQRDRSGRITGQSSSSSTGNTTFRDGSGRITGSAAAISEGGDITHRNGNGEITGREVRSTDGKSSTYRAANGTITGSASTSPAGVTTYRDSNGSITGSSSISGGTITYRDADGSITGTAAVK